MVKPRIRRAYSPTRARVKANDCGRGERETGGEVIRRRLKRTTIASLALARLVARGELVDDVDAALAPDQAVIAMPAAQRAKGIADFHGSFPFSDAVLGAGFGCVNRAKNGGRDRDRTCDPYHVKVVLFR